jgi:prepilin-type processing-associated H-X9-DG protein
VLISRSREHERDGALTTAASEELRRCCDLRIKREISLNILLFQPNVPIQVTLQSSQGVVVEGRHGNRMMFSLVDGRVMYVPPIVATRIEAEGIAAGERFESCKAQIKNGRGRSVEWALRRLDPEEQLVDVAPDAPPPETQIEHDLRVSIEMANAKKPSSELPEPPPPAPAPAIPTNGNGNGTGENTVSASPVPVTI